MGGQEEVPLTVMEMRPMLQPSKLFWTLAFSTTLACRMRAMPLSCLMGVGALSSRPSGRIEHVHFLDHTVGGFEPP